MELFLFLLLIFMTCVVAIFVRHICWTMTLALETPQQQSMSFSPCSESLRKRRRLKDDEMERRANKEHKQKRQTGRLLLMTNQLIMIKMRKQQTSKKPEQEIVIGSSNLIRLRMRTNGDGSPANPIRSRQHRGRLIVLINRHPVGAKFTLMESRTVNLKPERTVSTPPEREEKAGEECLGRATLASWWLRRPG